MGPVRLLQRGVILLDIANPAQARRALGDVSGVVGDRDNGQASRLFAR